MGHPGEFPFLCYVQNFQRVFCLSFIVSAFWGCFVDIYGPYRWEKSDELSNIEDQGIQHLRCSHFTNILTLKILQGILKSLKYRNSLDHQEISAQSPKTTWNISEPRPVWTLKDLEKPLIYPLTQGVMIFWISKVAKKCAVNSHLSEIGVGASRHFKHHVKCL